MSAPGARRWPDRILQHLKDGVIDADDDMAIPVWAGVIPLALRAGEAERDAACQNGDLPCLPPFLARQEKP